MPATATDRLQGLTTSVAMKPAVRVATTTAITLSGLQTVDGVALAAGDRVLVKSQGSSIANGIYVAGSGDWVRALDFDGSLDAVGGTLLYVNEGTVNGNTYWRVAGSGSKTVGSDALTFSAGLLSDGAAILYGPENVSISAVIETLRTGSLGRTSPDADTDWAPIHITGFGPNGPYYSDEPISVAYRDEVNDGMFSEGVWIAPIPIGDDFGGDGTSEAPWQSLDKAFRSSTKTNIHLLPREDGSSPIYEPGSFRADVSPDGCAKLRVLISHCSPDRPALIKRLCNNISEDASATGTISFLNAATVNGDTVVINGITINFTTSPSGPLDIDPGDGFRTENSAALISVINRNSSLLGVTATIILPAELADPAIVVLTANTPGSSGNAITLSCTSANTAQVASGATLTGGGVGWTDEGDGVWSYQLTEGYDLPRAVINHAVFNPHTGQPTPLAYYANARTVTFSGQPAVGNYIENTSGYGGDTRRLTFVASGGGTFNTDTNLGTVNIGATLAETLDNYARLVNSGLAVLFGYVVEPLSNGLRFWSRLNSNPNITATVSGANLSLAAQVAAKDSLAALSQNSDRIPFSWHSVGGWGCNESTLKLYVKLAGNLDVQANKENLELLVGDNLTARFFVMGARLGFQGAFQFRGTHLAPFIFEDDPVTFPTRIWGVATNSPEQPVGFITPMDTGMFEISGGQFVFQGAVGHYTTIDTHHITSFNSDPRTQVLDCGSEFAGDPYTFSLVEYPQRNALSPHGSGASTVVFNFLGNRSVGPLIGGDGVLWMVCAEGNNSWGVGGNQIGLLGLAGATYYIDSSNFAGNEDGDVDVTAGTNNVFRLGYNTIEGTGTGFIPPAP